MTILVTAASRHGATRELADAIATRLRQHDLEVDVQNPAAVTSLTGVDAAIIGSAVYAGRWAREGRALIGRLTPVPQGLPVWLFSSGPLGDDGAREALPLSTVDELVASTGAQEHRIFAGRLDRGRLSLAERAVAKAVHAPEGDFRDWHEVEAWADTIAATLSRDARQVEAS